MPLTTPSTDDRSATAAGWTVDTLDANSQDNRAKYHVLKADGKGKDVRWNGAKRPDGKWVKLNYDSLLLHTHIVRKRTVLGVQRCGCVTIGYLRKKVRNALLNGSVSNKFVRKKNSRELQPRSICYSTKKSLRGVGHGGAVLSASTVI